MNLHVLSDYTLAGCWTSQLSILSIADEVGVEPTRPLGQIVFKTIAAAIYRLAHPKWNQQDLNLYLLIFNQTCYQKHLSSIAHRRGIEPLPDDRQSSILADKLAMLKVDKRRIELLFLPCKRSVFPLSLLAHCTGFPPMRDV